MKKWVLIMCLCVVSCVKIDRDFTLKSGTYVFHIVPKVESEFDLSDEFIYNWDGLTDYIKPDSLFTDIYRNGKYYTTKKCDSSLVSVKDKDLIDIVVSNLRLNGAEYISHELYTDKCFNFIEEYPFCKELDNIFIGTNKFDIDLTKYTWQDSISRHYTSINTLVTPITKIYFVQIISDLQNIVCDSLLISGISTTHDFKVAENIIGNMWIPLKDKQIIKDGAVYAARFLSFGLPSGQQENYSWDISTTLKCYIAFKANNRYVKIDITQKMLTLTSGGIITIHINKDDLESGNYFDTDVENWNSQEIEIIL